MGRPLNALIGRLPFSRSARCSDASGPQVSEQFLNFGKSHGPAAPVLVSEYVALFAFRDEGLMIPATESSENVELFDVVITEQTLCPVGMFDSIMRDDTAPHHTDSKDDLAMRAPKLVEVVQCGAHIFLWL